MELNLRSSNSLRASLEACGFRRARNGRGFCRNGLRVTVAERWLTVHAQADPAAEPLRDDLGRPGLWKTVLPERPKRRWREFHVPLALLEGGASWGQDADAPSDPLRDCLDWAAATAEGDVPSGWTSPARELVHSWLPRGVLAIQEGPLLQQGSLVCEPGRLALRFELAGKLSPELSPARRGWLEKVLSDARNRWRMVRVGLGGPVDRPAVEAEVDFTGAPGWMLEGLLRAGGDALCWVVCWSVWSVAFLCDTRVTCRAWETPGAGLARRKEDESL